LRKESLSLVSSGLKEEGRGMARGKQKMEYRYLPLRHLPVSHSPLVSQIAAPSHNRPKVPRMHRGGHDLAA